VLLGSVATRLGTAIAEVGQRRPRAHGAGGGGAGASARQRLGRQYEDPHRCALGAGLCLSGTYVAAQRAEPIHPSPLFCKPIRPSSSWAGSSISIRACRVRIHLLQLVSQPERWAAPTTSPRNDRPQLAEGPDQTRRPAQPSMSGAVSGMAARAISRRQGPAPDREPWEMAFTHELAVASSSRFRSTSRSSRRRSAAARSTSTR